MRLAGFFSMVLALTPAVATAQQVVIGYQLGVTQSAGTTIGDVQIVAPIATSTALGQDANAIQAVGQNNQATVTQVQGLQLTTAVNGNVTFDIPTQTFNHAFVLGAGFAQIVPTLLPRDDDGNVPPGVTAQRTTTVNANANYVTNLLRPTYGLNLTLGYGFALNGQLQNGADGAAQGGQAGAQQNLPGQQIGAFSFNGQTHNVNAGFGLVLTPDPEWDLALRGNYGYTQNGLFTVAAGALGNQNQVGAVRTNLGAFVPANLHTLGPSITFRSRAGRRGQIDVNYLTTVTLTETVDDSVTITGTTTTVFRSIPPPPASIINTIGLQYTYAWTDQRTIGAAATSNFNFRIPSDALGQALTGATFAADTLIYQFRAIYADLLPWELRITAGLGVAQAWLFQPPLGAQGDLDTFESVRSNWEPIFDLTLSRLFDPVNVNLTLNRGIAVGALGVSAIVTEAANLTFTYAQAFGEFRPQINVGFNANRVRGVGADNFTQAPGANNLIALASNNRGFGANAGFGVPLFDIAGLAFDLTATYNFAYVDPDPTNMLGIEPLVTHTILGSIRAIYGRGTAQAAGGGGGTGISMQDELDAFTADPANGSPYLSSQLIEQGAPLQLGRRVGQPPEARRDSRRAYQQAIQEAAREQAARDQSGVIQGAGTVQEEARREALDEEAEPPPPPRPIVAPPDAPPPPPPVEPPPEE